MSAPVSVGPHAVNLWQCLRAHHPAGLGDGGWGAAAGRDALQQQLSGGTEQRANRQQHTAQAELRRGTVHILRGRLPRLSHERPQTDASDERQMTEVEVSGDSDERQMTEVEVSGDGGRLGRSDEAPVIGNVQTEGVGGYFHG